MTRRPASAPKLVKLGVVASSRAFVLAAEHSTSGAGLLPGFYGMHEHMKASLAYALLVNPDNMVQVKVTIPEGWRLSQLVSYLGAKSGISASAYAKALKDPAVARPAVLRQRQARGLPVPRDLLGGPARDRHRGAEGHGQAVQPGGRTRSNLITGSQHVGLTPGQVITMASLVQAEGGRLSDYPKIARGDLQPAEAGHPARAGQHRAVRPEHVRHHRQRQAAPEHRRRTTPTSTRA